MTATEHETQHETERPPLSVEELLLRGRPALPFTYEEVDALPNEGYRYELVDGVLIVSPGPTRDHQRVLRDIFRQLDAACPEELEILFAPYDMKPSEERKFQPDILVGRPDDFGMKWIERPLLVVEVGSPSTRLVDRTLKRAVYEEAGVASYWLVDPAEPSLTVLELRDGRYVQVGHVTGDDVYEASTPYQVTIRLR